MDNRTKGWLFVAAQFALIGFSVFSPAVRSGEFLHLIGFCLFFFGSFVAALSLRDLGKSLTAHPMPLANATLRTDGFYRFVRHPIYFGLLTTMLGITVMAPSILRWLLWLGLVLLLNQKANWEEQFLRERYPKYADYAASVPRILPRRFR